METQLRKNLRSIFLFYKLKRNHLKHNSDACIWVEETEMTVWESTSQLQGWVTHKLHRPLLTQIKDKVNVHSLELWNSKLLHLAQSSV